MPKRVRLFVKQPVGSKRRPATNALDAGTDLRDSDSMTEYELAASPEVTDAASLSADSDDAPSTPSVEIGPDSDSDVAAGGVCLGSDEDGPRLDAPLGWEPGYSSGQWISKENPMQPQSQVLSMNVLMCLRRVPAQILQQLRSALGHERKPGGGGGFALYVVAAAQLLCLSHSRLYRLMKALSDRSWNPVEHSLKPNRGGGEARRGGDAVPTTADEGREVLMTLVRSALASSVTGSSGNAFIQHVSRLALEGVKVGSKFHTRHFVRDAQHLAAKVLQAQNRLDLDTQLKGLGIPSNIAVLFDGVPVGGVTTFNRHGNVEVICVASISPSTGRIHTRFAAWGLSDAGHSGAAVANAILRSLAEQPLGLDVAVLRRRLSAVGGDGFVVRGGPDRKKPGTQAADLLWFAVHPRAEPALPEDDDFLRQLVRVERPRGGVDDWVDEPHVLHSVTEWDKFHRQDIALTRAISKCSLAEEMYATCSMMDHLFGLGDGRLLMRAVAEVTGSVVCSGRLPGMTRKAVQLCSEPGHLIQNFKCYAAGLRLREAWRAAGHDKSKAQLVDAGRRLTSPQLVSFTLLFRDIMQTVVSPWVQTIQSSSIEPWVVSHHWQKHEAKLQSALRALHHLRELLRLLVLLRQWATVADLHAFAHALFYAKPRQLFAGACDDGLDGQALGRLFPAFLLGFSKMLHGSPPRFRGVELLSVSEPWQSQYRLLGPHCQCMFLRPRQRREKVKVKIKMPLWVRGQRRDPGKCGFARVIQVPLWVSGAPVARGRRVAQVAPELEDSDSSEPSTLGHNALGAQQTQTQPVPAPIRFQWRPLDQLSVAAGVRPEGRFRPRIGIHRRKDEDEAGHTSACMLPATLPQTFKEIDSSLKAGHTFLESLLKEECQLFGPEGTSAGLAKAQKSMARCFDWGRLTSSVPTADDLNAFADLSGLLLPYLRLTEWPAAESFPDVVRGWPDRSGLLRQYVLLMNRVRHAGRQCPGATKDWWKIAQYRVTPIVCISSVLGVLGVALYRAAPPNPGEEHRCHTRYVYRIASIVSHFVGCSNTLAVRRCKQRTGSAIEDTVDPLVSGKWPREILVSDRFLARPGFPFRGRSRMDFEKRVVKEKWGVGRPEPANLAVLLLPGCVGKLVHVESATRELDWSAVSASIDCNPYFARDGPKSGSRGRTSAWHAVKVHHHCRLMGVPEAACERVGSMMKANWMKNPSAPVSTLMKITSLTAARVSCSGTARDEALCRAVVEAMESMGRKAALSKRFRQAHQKAGIDTSRAIMNFRQDAAAQLHAAGLSEAFDDVSDSDGQIDTGSAAAPARAPTRARAAAIASKGQTLKHLTSSIAQDLKKSTPSMQLPSDVKKELQRATLNNAVAALPLRQERRHKAASPGLAGSVLQQRLNLWLSSEAGAAWKKERDARVDEALQ